MWHHRLSSASVNLPASTGFDTIASFSVADPGGGAGCLKCYNWLIDQFPNPVIQAKVALALQRLLSGDISAALPRTDGPATKKKKLSFDSSAASTSASASASTSAASTLPPPAVADADSSTTDADFSSDSDSEGDSSKKSAAAHKDSKISTKEANTMMEDIGSEVSFWCARWGRLSFVYVLSFGALFSLLISFMFFTEIEEAVARSPRPLLSSD